MLKHLFVFGLLALASAQEDNFQCPDEFEGFYPHLYSCDKYWHCKTGKASLKLCGNGLVFNDLDPTYTTENCDYMHNVECGERTEIEPPISAPNCPRLYGTFPDPEDCTGFYNCRDGVSNRYSCAPGLAFDPKDRVCKWADQVMACKKQKEEEEGAGAFICPSAPAGTFTKHPHPEDCRQYYVCIAGTPREYGCPLGTVFKIGPGENDGKCADPEDVPECANYYGDLEFDKQDLVRAGVDPEAVGAQVAPTRSRVNPAQARPRVTASRPEPAILDDDLAFDAELRTVDLPPPSPPVNEERARIRSRPPPSPLNSIPVSKNRPQTQTRFTLSQRAPTVAPVTTTTTATTFVFEDTTTSATEPPAPLEVDNSFTPAVVAPANLPPATGERQPAKVKAGEDYYYYYYYYDDEDEAAQSQTTA